MRKILWARSGNLCAVCRVPLVVERTATDKESIVGEEAHIISSAANGPRHDPNSPAEMIDDIENLVLLCATHHKTIDDQVSTYSAEAVRGIKRNHERWVKTKLSSV